MAAYSNSTSQFDTNGITTITNVVPITPNIGDLMLIMVGTTGQATPAVAATVTDNCADGLGTYTFVGSALRTASADVMAVYVRNALVASASSTSGSADLGANNGAFLVLMSFAGITRFGSAAIRTVGVTPQFAREQNQTTGAPQPVYSSITLTSNPQVTGIYTNGGNPPNISGPTNFVSRVNGGYNTPTSGLQIYTIDGGNTSTALNWAGSTGSAYCDFAVELDSSLDPVLAAASTPIPFLGRGASW